MPDEAHVPEAPEQASAQASAKASAFPGFAELKARVASIRPQLEKATQMVKDMNAKVAGQNSRFDDEIEQYEGIKRSIQDSTLAGANWVMAGLNARIERLNEKKRQSVEQAQEVTTFLDETQIKGILRNTLAAFETTKDLETHPGTDG